MCVREKTSYTHCLVISIASDIHWRATEDSSVGSVNNIYIWSLFFLKLKKYYETSNKFAFVSFYLENITTMKIILKFGMFWLYVKSPKLKPSPLKLCCKLIILLPQPLKS